MSYNVVFNHPKYAPGQTAYIIENGLHTTPVSVIRTEGTFGIVRFPTGGVSRLKTDRLFATEAEAKVAMPKHPELKRCLR